MLSPRSLNTNETMIHSHNFCPRMQLKKLVNIHSRLLAKVVRFPNTNHNPCLKVLMECLWYTFPIPSHHPSIKARTNEEEI